MKDLEDFIAANRAVFDGEDLPHGHEERFFTKWEAGRLRRRLRLRFLGAAAAVVLVWLSGWGLRELAFSESAVEARMLRRYRQEVEVLRQQVGDYVATLSPVYVEQIEYAVQLFTEDLDRCAEWLPLEISPAQRRRVLEDYYAHCIAGMEQMVLLIAEYTNN
ncbi:MAG: hypothetical protein FWE30_06090 [Bacteroidales bacterium]|nr:hypothetical protein [Bacteroidales bacterium]MCL2738998.1 hypothetical protein [Bacteroidales bacterium]